MYSMTRHLKYPFSQEARTMSQKLARDLGDLVKFVSLPENEHIVEAAEDRVYRALKDGYIQYPPFDDERDVLIYPTARVIVEGVRDSRLRAKQAEAEEKAVNRELGKEKPEFISEICATSFKWKIESTGDLSERAELPLQLRTFDFRIRFENFLEVSPMFKSREWALANRFLSRGWVLVRRAELVRMASAKFRQIILGSRLELPPLTGRLTQSVERIQSQLPKKREYTRPEETQETAFPPCMDLLYRTLKNGHHLAHAERFTLAAFLNKINVARDEIKRVFGYSPDARGAGSIIDYQVDHIASKGSRSYDDDSEDTGYMPYNCKRMRELGICPVDKGDVFDPLCEYVVNPLSFYNRRAWEVSKGYKPNPAYYGKNWEKRQEF